MIRKPAKLPTFSFVIYWISALFPNITFLIVEWYYALIISNIIYTLIAYNNSRKTGYPVFKAIIPPLLFNVVGGEIVTRKMNKIHNPKQWEEIQKGFFYETSSKVTKPSSGGNELKEFGL